MARAESHEFRGDASDLRLTEGVELGHALVDRAARDVGARVLFIKGPVLAAQGLRPPRISVDVDVLVHPDDAARLRVRLGELGWHVRVPSTTVHVMPFHSVTVAHPAWPCEIDVHHRFPGFLTDPTTVFDTLWARRTQVTVAGVDIAATDLIGSALIMALHSLRAMHQPRHHSELELLRQVLGERLDDRTLRELAKLAAATGASQTAKPLLDSLGAPTVSGRRVSPEDLRGWRVMTTAAGTHSVAWVDEFRRTPINRWLPLAWHAVTLSESEIRLLYPDVAPGRRGLLLGRLRRLRRGLRDVPAAIRIVRRGRHTNG